jgi:glycosyltransferase involved in cell wall biosynthesis
MEPTKALAGSNILLIVENESVPFDRRMWNISLALRDLGADVTVVCPKFGPDSARDEVRDGVHVLRYNNTFADGTVWGYAREYGTAFFKTWWLLLKVLLGKRIHVVHAANPPDIFWSLALFLKLFGVKFIFDEHDLAPEAFLSRFEKEEQDGGILYKLQFLFEKLNYRFADATFSTNQTYRGKAIARYPAVERKNFVVRNGPDTRIFYPRAGDPALKKGRTFLAAFIGVMAIQDGVEYILQATDVLVHEMGFTDFIVYLIGKGDDWDRLKAMTVEKNLQDHIVFTGRIGDPEALAILSTADVCLSPDPQNPLNDSSTMTKVMEYMALGKPTVSFHLRENTFSAGDAALYVDNNNPRAFAEGMHALFQDPALRRRLGEAGTKRVHEVLSWQNQVRELERAYEFVLGRS